MDRARRLVPLVEVQPQRVRWLWANRIPLDAITILEGDPGEGKSTVAYDLIARLTSGRAMPNCDPGSGPAGAVLLQSEDAVGSIVRPRLQAAGADLARVRVYERSRFAGQPLTIPDDLPVLEREVASPGKA
jgi:hypothetical protein